MHFQLNFPEEDEEPQAGTRHGRRRKDKKQQPKKRAGYIEVPPQPDRYGSRDDDDKDSDDDDDDDGDHQGRRHSKNGKTPSVQTATTVRKGGANRGVALHHNVKKNSKSQKRLGVGKGCNVHEDNVIKDYNTAVVQANKIFPTAIEDLTTDTMATQRPPQTTERPQQGISGQQMQYVFVEGTFADHAQDMANHLNLELDVKPLIEKGQTDEVLKKLILASTALNSEPEKEFCAHYNLLIYLVLESDNVGMLLPRVCDNLTKPITSSPINGPGLALGALTTIFNLLQKRTEQNNELRFNVFVTIVRFVKLHGMYADIKKCLSSVKGWLALWETDEEDQRKLFLDIAELAHDAGDDK